MRLTESQVLPIYIVQQNLDLNHVRLPVGFNPPPPSLEQV